MRSRCLAILTHRCWRPSPGSTARALGAAIHDAVASTLLVAATTPLGVTWRHRLMRDAVRGLLLPLEQQAMARRGADHLVDPARDPSDGDLRQAATLYELAGYPEQAARQLIRAARAAVSHAALDVAERYLGEAYALTGIVPDSALAVLVERIETMSLAGRSGDAYHSGAAALRGLMGPDGRRLMIATARAAYGAGLHDEAAQLVTRLELADQAADADLAVLRAHRALADRRTDAIDLGEQATSMAMDQGRFDIACEALVIVGITARRHNIPQAGRAFQRALAVSEQHQLPVWQVRVLADLGMIDHLTDSDPTRFHQARELATASGMAGMVAAMDSRIFETITMRAGFVAGYPTIIRADAQARQLQLTGLYAETRAHLAHCLLHADNRSLPGRTHAPTKTTIDDLIAEALALGERSKPVPWATSILGTRALFNGDSAAAIRLMDDGLNYLRDEIKMVPGWGVAALLHVVAGADPDDAFGAPELIGHHTNWAARRYADAVHHFRTGQSATESIVEAETYLLHTPFARHRFRTIVAPTMCDIDRRLAIEWLREADAFCAAAGERALQRRVHHAFGSIGAAIPRAPGAAVPPGLARSGITPRETEILRLVNRGLSNPDIADHLVISVRTVESHVSSLLQKTGRTTRNQLPSAEG